MAEQPWRFSAWGRLLLLEEGDELASSAPGDVQDTASRKRTTGIGSSTRVKHRRRSVFKIGGGSVARVVGVMSIRPAAAARLGERVRSRRVLGVLRDRAENPSLTIQDGVRHSAIALGDVARRRDGCGGAVLACEGCRRTNRRRPA